MRTFRVSIYWDEKNCLFHLLLMAGKLCPGIYHETNAQCPDRKKHTEKKHDAKT